MFKKPAKYTVVYLTTDTNSYLRLWNMINDSTAEVIDSFEAAENNDPTAAYIVRGTKDTLEMLKAKIDKQKLKVQLLVH